MHNDEMGSASRDLALIEAALFLSPQPMTRRGLAKLLGGVQLAYVDQLLDELRSELDPSAHGIELFVEEGCAVLRVRPDLVEQVAHLAPQQDIPRPLLRTLAVIAYNHPMTQADVVRVRGNKAYGHVQELLDRRLIRAEEHGKTLLLHVTKEFLQSFGLRTVEEFRFHVASTPGMEQQLAEDTGDAGVTDDEDAEMGYSGRPGHTDAGDDEGAEEGDVGEDEEPNEDSDEDSSESTADRAAGSDAEEGESIDDGEFEEDDPDEGDLEEDEEEDRGDG